MKIINGDKKDRYAVDTEKAGEKGSTMVHRGLDSTDYAAVFSVLADDKTAAEAIVPARSKFELSFILLQPFCQPGDAFFEINLGSPT
jgi:hypothetical protein